ncbi:MAG: HEAT repeat domain-containing protein, partial [Bacteroidales bacterium]|nr:HEAT repeat domain-containing protein [Bacteroidales bacterium]
MKSFKKIILLLFVILMGLPLLTVAAERIIPQAGKFDTRFLIVIDSKSFDQAQSEVMAYKKVLEEQGLGAVVMIGDWDSPDDLKKDILKIYKKKPVMEGVVFVGDIPVVRVRNFQHATTAFKMNETEFPIEESSVTSDRFYDDLDLEFEFLSVDEKNPRHFYYKLKESSPQVIESEFYSARMMPPGDMGVDVYELLRRYLRKVVLAHSEVNYADNIKFFNGHGYNFDCLTVWQNQQFAIKEQFPEAFVSSRGNAFYNFRQDPFMKFKLMERMQKQGTDLFVFHEHGAFDTQYING